MAQKILVVVCMLFCSLLVHAQEATVKGKLTKQGSKETLVGATIKVEDGNTGTITDIDGNYTLKVKAGTVKLKFNSVGYRSTTKTVKLIEGEERVLNIALEEDLKELDLVVVSGSRYEKQASHEVVTVEVLNKGMIKGTNAIDLSEAITKVPGVSVIDGQANIRSGSGFSYGVGSRVLLLVDDVPLLDGALGDARWKFVPIENAEQVEVIKGASSVLYGSSALNGIINVRTGYAKDSIAENSMQLYSTIVDDPKRSAAKWWTPYAQPFATGGFFNHKQRIKNFDLTIGANYNMTRSYQQEGDEKRFRVDFKTRWRPAKREGLSVGIDGNVMFEQSGRTFLWLNADSGIYKSNLGSGDNYLLFNIDPWVTYFDKKGNRHTLKTRYYRTYRFGSADGKVAASISDQGYVDYQYQRHIGTHFVITAGTSADASGSSSNLFPGNRQAGQAAVFSQFEYKYKKLSLVAGVREELNFVDSLVEFATPVFRAGLNYQVGKTTYLRASWGQGYRFPTVGERFVDANLSLLHITPNPALVAEKGWSAEIALKQGIKIDRWLGYFDFCLFWMEYKDFVDYTFANSYYDTTVHINFQPRNVSRARLAGYEASVVGQGNFGPVIFRTLLGVTYSFPADLVNDSSQRNVGTFLKNVFTDMKGISYFDDKEKNKILKYRNMYLIRTDFEIEYKWASIGYSLNYGSFIANYDKIFNVFGINEYYNRRKGQRGDLTMDMRLAVQASKKIKLAFIIKNLTNLEYAVRPGVMNSPRNFTLQVGITI